MSKQVVIIGAGILGVSTAYRFQLRNTNAKVVVLEKSSNHRGGQTGNNSGVIHSPLNYAQGSLKARNCADGRRLLIDLCDTMEVPYRICGKILVARSEDEIPQLEKKLGQALGNGISDAQLLTAEEVLEREPNVTCARGLLIPGTGVIDFGKVAERLGETVVEKGGELHFNTEVLGIRRTSSGWVISTSQGEFECDVLVNCAGLQSDRITRMAGLRPKGRIIPVMGMYYRVKEPSASLVRDIIYPLPPPIPVLGVHVHRTINNEVHAGPNAVVNLAREIYKFPSFDMRDFWEMVSYPGFWMFVLRNLKVAYTEARRSFSKALFAAEVQRLVPGIQEEDLELLTPGIRAQLVGPFGHPADDFVITEADRIVCCESGASPGATACLSNAEMIVDKVVSQLQ